MADGHNRVMRLTVPELKPAAERYVSMTLDVIAERGTSVGANMREVSRRLGHAHTNVYNYFDSYERLLEHALRRATIDYAKAMSASLHDHLSARDCFVRFTRNVVEWHIQNPGYSRFIATDPLDPEALPRDIIDNVTTMKAWMADLLQAIAGPRIEGEALTDLRDILLGYLGGEIMALVYGRVLPGEDPAERVLRNAETLFVLLVTRSGNSGAHGDAWAEAHEGSCPVFQIETMPLESKDRS